MPKRVLIAEDNDELRELYKSLLQLASFDCEVTTNGKEAVEAFQQSRQPFDIVILDVMMPVMDGCEAARLLIEKGYQGKIVFLTALDIYAFRPPPYAKAWFKDQVISNLSELINQELATTRRPKLGSPTLQLAQN